MAGRPDGDGGAPDVAGAPGRGVNPSTALATTVVDELVRGGVEHVVLAPGSRSTALALAVASRPGLRLHVRHDERSAAFLALGLGRATGHPAVVVTTSGTAVANLAPAVAEAHAGGVPLVLLTADRPFELRRVGANQTFGQAHLFGGLLRWQVELPAAADAPGEPSTWRSTIARVVAAARGLGGALPPDATAAPGPVQANLAFREPTVPGLDDGRSRARAYGQDLAGRPDGRPWTRFHAGSGPGVEADVLDLVARAFERRVVLVAGDLPHPVEGLSALHDRGIPVVAEPTAAPGLGGGTPHGALVLAAAGHGPLRPEVVVRLGHPTLARAALEGLADVPTIQVTAAGLVDPTRAVTDAVAADPGDLVAALVAHGVGAPPVAHARAWAEAGEVAREVVAAHLDRLGAPEPAVARRVAAALGGRDLVVASSLPARDLDAYADRPAARAGRTFANRGLAGIDGFTSTAVGIALARGPTVALAGDLSFLHDHNGLLVGDPATVPLVLVVVDNDGGGIFHEVPAAGLEQFERLFATPHGRDLVAVASAAGIPSEAVPVDEVGAELGRATTGLRVLVVRTDRVAGTAARRAIVADLARHLGAGA